MDDTDYAFGRSRAEYDRLIEQAELFRPLTERVLLAAGISRGMHVLDVGCGLGDVSFLVAGMVGPEGSVVGVDLDAKALEFAEKRRTGKATTNVEFRQSDLRSVHTTERLFDAAVGRFVLMFVHDPTATLRQIAERIRPGGIVAFHEWDARVTTAPAINQPVLARLQGLFVRTFERSGARLELGAELHSRMLEIDLEPDPSPLAEIAVHMGNGEVAYRPGGITGLADYESCRRLRSNASTLRAKGNFSFGKNPASQSASACVGCFSNSQKYFFNAKYNRKSCISLKLSNFGRSSSKSQNFEGFNPLNSVRNCPTFCLMF
jgi:ubiquinone/menaquinone biosynthesis C-methylase UbiE